MPHDIFLSYSRKDAAHADDLTARLRDKGLDVWIDRQGIEGAERWATEIVEGIRACSTFMVLLSPNSIESEHVLKELSLASEKRKRLLPVDLAPTELPSSFEYALAGLQRVPISDFEGILRAHQHGVERQKTKDDRKSLIILPFEDLSPAIEDNTWFADGLTGELISALSKIKSLRIPDLKTSMDLKRYHGRTTDIARELSVRYFIQGTVRKFGPQIKVGLELLDIETGDYLWQHSYRGEFKDIFDIQEAIANEVAIGLKLHLTKEESERVGDRRTANAEAYELFLRAGQYSRLNTKENYEYALKLYLEAIQLDPQFVDALAWAANAHMALYRAYDRNRLRLETAETLIFRALEFDPDFDEALIMLSRLRMYQERLEEAERHALQSVELSPGNQNAHFALGFFYYNTGRPEKAISPYEKTIALMPGYHTAHWNLVAAFERIGNKEAAREAALRAIPLFESRLRLAPDDEHAHVYLANLYYIAGQMQNASRALRELSDAHDGDSLYNLGCLASRLGQFDLALDFLVKARDAGFVRLETFLQDPDLDPLRTLPAFENLIESLRSSPQPNSAHA